MSTLSDEFGLGSSAGSAQQKRSSLADEFELSTRSKQNTSLLGDLGTDLKRGVQKLPGVATGLADVAVAGLTGHRFVDETADRLGEMTGFQPSKWADEARDEYSDARKAGAAEIDKAWDEGTATDVAGAYLSNPGNVAGLVVESLPQMLAGGVVGRGALAAGRATGLVGAPATAAQAATQGAIAGGVGEGAVMAGGAMDQISDDVDPRRAAAAAAATGIVGGALGAAGAKVAQRLGVLDAESAIAGGIREASGEVPGVARRMAGGALTEGVFEELPQSVQETALQNWAEEKDLTDGMARAAVEGTLAGSAMGAGVNVIPPRKRSEEMGLDPSAGPLSAAAVTAVDSQPALLPGPGIAGALPAPDQVLYADSNGNVSEQGPVRDVDREQRPVPGREQPVRDFGPGMEQQVNRGAIPVTGEPIPAMPGLGTQQESEPRTFDAEPVRQAIPDLREDAINVDAQGNASPGKLATHRQADYVQGGRGMDQQAPIGRVFGNAFAARNAIQRVGGTETLEAVRVGPKQFEVRAISAPVATPTVSAADADPASQPVEQSASPAAPGNVVAAAGRARLLSGMPDPDNSPANGYRPASRLIVTAQQMFRTEVDPTAFGHLRFYSYRPDYQTWIEVPLKEAMTAARQRIAQEAGQEDAGNESAKPQESSGSSRDVVTDLSRDRLSDGGVTSPRVTGRPVVAGPASEPGGDDIPAAAQGGGGRRALSERPATDESAERKPAKRVPRGEKPAGAADQTPTPAKVSSVLSLPKKPRILRVSREKYIDGDVKKAKANLTKAGLEETSPDYQDALDKAVRIIGKRYDQERAAAEVEHEKSIDRAYAAMAFEQYNELNSDSPEGVNRQAWEALRQEFGQQQYSRNSYRRAPEPGQGVRAGQLRLQLQRLTSNWRNAPKIKAVQSVKDLPDAQRRQVERDGAFDVEGMFADGQVYLVADNLRDAKHAAFVLQHEVLGHAGLQGAYGQRLTPLLMSIYNSNAELKQQADSLVKQFGYSPSIAMEEVLADMAADGSLQQQSFWGRLVAAMRNVLRSILGDSLSWSEGDIRALLGNARRYIENGKHRPGARAAFSRDGRSFRGPEIADEKGRLLAPDGKPSKLNQRQWHQVRSPSFKKWFGNWQGLSAEKRLDAMPPLKLRAPEAWRGLSESERLKAITVALKGMAKAGDVLHHAELGDIRMYMGGVKKAVHSAADPAKKTVLAKLRESFENSVYFGYRPDDQGRPDVLAFHRLMMPIDINGEKLVAIFTLKESRDGKFFYNAVTVVRKEEAPAAYPGEVSRAQITTPAFTGASTSAASPRDMSNEAQRSTSAITKAGSFVRQSLRRVNPDDVSKVIDGNGEPLVLHRGTGEQFTIFDQGRAGRSTGHSTAPLGIFMTEDAELADAYAEKAADGMPGLANVMPLYASIKKPYQMSLAESQSLDTPQKSMAFRQKLENEGFDGIRMQGSPVWIAFYNDQVKSATSNTGAFDSVNPDIRYRRAGQGNPNVSDIFTRFSQRQTDPNDLFSAENQRLREQDKTLWDKAKREFRRQFAPGGLLPDAVFGEKVKRDSEFQAVEFDVRHLARGLENAIKTDFGMAIDELPAGQMARLADALAGKVDPTLPEATKVAIVSMRQYIDSLSSEYVGILKQQVRENLQGTDPALIEKITENMGSYVHRSYQAFDDPKWFQKVPTEVVNAARHYLAKGYMDQGDGQKDAYARADVKINEMLKTGTAYDSMESFIAEGKLGAKDLSVLIKRKSIAPEIRALLGEYTDPRLNFAKSATKMGRLIWNQRFLDRVRDAGMGTFLFDGKDRPAGATVQIAGEKSDAYAPLNGLWTFPDVAQAFKDSLGKEQMSDLYRTIVRYNGMVKYGKTVLSPTTAMRNWQSAMFFSLANGHFDLTQMKHSWAALREQVTQNATGDDLAYLRKLKQLGVVYDTPYAGEMMALLNDARMDELLSGKSGAGIKWLRKINEVAQGFYSFGDDFWKIIGFENEKASLIKAGIPAAQAEQMAAERIRSTYPTYSMVGRGINWLRRFPLVGTFVSFPAEIIRTSVNMLQLTAADLKSDNPGLQAIGRKRVMGLAMVSAGFYAMAAMTAAAFGVGDDEDEAIRDLAAPWQRNSTFLYTGRDADGKLRYFDMSFLDPYGYWKRPLTAMMRDQPWEKAAASGIADMLAPFLGADIAAGAIFEVLANKKGSGGQVYLENAGAVDQTTAIADHLRKALQPGFMSNAERLLLAGQGARREGSGQPYDMHDEVVSLLGWRASTLDTQTALYYRSFEFTDSLRDASKTLNRTLRSSNDVSDGDIRSSREAAQKQYDQAFKEMGRLVKSARAAGMNNQQIMQTLRNSGVTGQNAMALSAGRVPMMNAASLQGQTKAMQQARMMQGSEHAQEIARRFAVARQL